MKKILVLTLALAGCASPANVIPNEGGSYSTQGQGATEKAAMAQALDAASTTCQKQGRTFVVSNHKTTYSGASPTQKKVYAVVAAVENAKPNVYVPPELQGDNDYQVALTFRCADATK